MITPYTINNAAWTPLTTAGKSGKCWLDVDGDGESGGVDIRSFNTDGTPDVNDLTNSPRVYEPNSNVQFFEMLPDSPEDIFYARAFKAGDGATVIVNESLGTAVLSGKRDVNIQDQTTPSVEHYMFQELADIVITGTPTKGTNVLTLSPGHGFVAPVPPNRDYLNIHYVDDTLPELVGIRFSQHGVVAVAGDVISITPPLSFDLDPAKVESSKRVNVDMAVLGTFVAPVKFQTYPPNGLKWDLTRFIADMILSSGADDGKFGNIAQLIYGEYFGFESPAFTQYALTVFDNGDFRSSAFDVLYTTRSGGSGDFGMATRKTSAGQDKLGVTVRLDGALSDLFAKYTQDDLRALVRYRIKIMGHIVED